MLLCESACLNYVLKIETFSPPQMSETHGWTIKTAYKYERIYYTHTVSEARNTVLLQKIFSYSIEFN